MWQYRALRIVERLTAIGVTNMPAETRDREQPLREATRALDARQIQAARERGAAMTLAAAAEYAIVMTGERAPAPAAEPAPGTLSSRERELITLVARGQTSRAQIVSQLFISVSTVRSHLDLGSATRAAAAAAPT